MGSGLNLCFIVLSTDALRTSFIQHIQHRFHNAGQVKDGAGTHPFSILIKRLSIGSND